MGKDVRGQNSSEDLYIATWIDQSCVCPAVTCRLRRHVRRGFCSAAPRERRVCVLSHAHQLLYRSDVARSPWRRLLRGLERSRLMEAAGLELCRKDVALSRVSHLVLLPLADGRPGALPQRRALSLVLPMNLVAGRYEASCCSALYRAVHLKSLVAGLEPNHCDRIRVACLELSLMAWPYRSSAGQMQAHQ